MTDEGRSVSPGPTHLFCPGNAPCFAQEHQELCPGAELPIPVSAQDKFTRHRNSRATEAAQVSHCTPLNSQHSIHADYSHSLWPHQSWEWQKNIQRVSSTQRQPPRSIQVRKMKSLTPITHWSRLKSQNQNSETSWLNYDSQCFLFSKGSSTLATFAQQPHYFSLPSAHLSITS